MAMVFQWRLLTAFGALALVLGGVGIPAQAAKARCTSEECACEQALRQNTVEALEKFLKKYPQSTDSGKTACAALAVPSQDEGYGDQRSDEERTPDEPGDSRTVDDEAGLGLGTL